LKKIRLFVLAVTLTLLIAAPSFAATHSWEGEYCQTDSFFSISPNSAYLQAYYFYSPTTDIFFGKSTSHTGIAEYYVNDQTFVNFGRTILSNDDWDFMNMRISQIRGSYLFKCGFFAGLNYSSSYYDGDTEDETIFSPGYRYNFDDNSYIAFSVDYSNYVDDINGYDFDFRFYQDKYKIAGQIYKIKDGDVTAAMETAYQFTDTFTAGLSLSHDEYDNNWFETGFTWTPGSVIFDGIYGYDSDHYLMVNGMYRFTKNFAAGLRIYDEEDYDDLRGGAIIKFTSDKTNLSLLYFPENDSWSKKIEISFFKTF
jgi:hypothetical protein